MAENKETTFGAGQQLFRQGEKSGDLYFIKEGEIELQVRNDDTGEEAIVGTKGAREVLGTLSFLEGLPRTATATCKTEVKAVVISQQQREKMLATVPQWAGVLIKDLTASLRNMNNQFAHLTVENQKLTKRVEQFKAKEAEAEKKED
jgi:CRP-like cAMP-binding protein